MAVGTPGDTTPTPKPKFFQNRNSHDYDQRNFYYNQRDDNALTPNKAAKVFNNYRKNIGNTTKIGSKIKNDLLGISQVLNNVYNSQVIDKVIHASARLNRSPNDMYNKSSQDRARPHVPVFRTENKIPFVYN